MKKLIKFLLSFAFVIALTGSQQTIHADPCECGENGKAFSKFENGILYDIYNLPVSFAKLPARTVSLVPAVTEMIEAVNPGYELSGITTHDSDRKIAAKARIVGGFYRPDVKKIKELRPDIIFSSSLHEAIHNEFKDSGTRVIILEAQNADELYRNIEIIGKLFHGEKKAAEVITGIRAKIENIRKKLSGIPMEKRVRVMRLMGFDGKKLGTPGDDSFQTEAIKLAGGIPVKTGRDGQITYISTDEWNKFNPQAVYSCGDAKMWDALKKNKAWNNTDAVKNSRHFIFPCDLTCRASVNYGAFIESLSAALYGKHFFSIPPVKKDGSFLEKKININIPYIGSAAIKYGTIDDFEHKTLVLGLTRKMEVLSTLSGLKIADTVGNHYLSPPRWQDSHSVTVEALEKKICNALGKDASSSAFLITGADMDNLAVVMKEYKSLKVYALVTAGVKSNAQRKSKDEGLYYPYGTINMIILTNAHLSQGAMGQAVIAATEAKTAALQDFDIRSSYTGLLNQATGTGTDNIIVISGEGAQAESAGGHTKTGELTALAAYEGVIKAVGMQNGIRSARSMHRRLDERNISVAQIASFAPAKNVDPQDAAVCIERALLDPEIAGFLESAFAISDAASKNLITDCYMFNKWCLEVSAKIAGKKPDTLIPVSFGENRNSPLNTAISAILTGAVNKINQQ